MIGATRRAKAAGLFWEKRSLLLLFPSSFSGTTIFGGVERITPGGQGAGEHSFNSHFRRRTFDFSLLLILFKEIGDDEGSTVVLLFDDFLLASLFEDDDACCFCCC